MLRASRLRKPVPTARNVPQGFPGVGQGRGVGTHPGDLWPHLKERGRAGSAGKLRRRLVYRRKVSFALVSGKGGNGTKVMAVVDRPGLALAICIESASPHEVTLVEKTIGSPLCQCAAAAADP